jgi:hypothetical protein
MQPGSPNPHLSALLGCYLTDEGRVVVLAIAGQDRIMEWSVSVPPSSTPAGYGWMIK